MRLPGSKRAVGLACAALGLLSTFSMTYVVRVGMSFATLNDSVVAILLWAASYAVLRKAAARLNGRLLAVSSALGFLFAFAMVCGSMVCQYGEGRLEQMKTWIGILCATPLSVAVFALLLDAPYAIRWPTRKPLKRWDAMPPRRAFILAWALVFLAWLPGLIASYPGVYGYDCIYQIQYYLAGELSTHHPILHTKLLGFCVVTLGERLGSYEAGMCVYSVLQMLVFSASFASMLSWLKRRAAPPLFRLAALLIAMFLPTNAIMSFSGTKDVLFSAFVLWELLLLLDAEREPARLAQWRFWGKLLGVSLLLMSFRNQGVYIFAFTMLCALLVTRGARARIAALLAVGLALFAVYQGPVSTWMGAKRVDTVKEALSVPCVQLARARRESADALSETDKASIEAYLPDWSEYNESTWGISDPVKASFNTEAYRQDSAAFFRLWARVGRQCPTSYLNAFLRMSIGFWYPDMPYPDWSAHHPYFEYANTNIPGDWLLLKRSTPACLRWLNELYDGMAYSASYQKIPVFSLLLSTGLYAWLMLAFTGFAIYKKRYRLLSPAALLIGLWGTMLLGPVVLLRYSYALLMCAPTLLWLMTAPEESR